MALNHRMLGRSAGVWKFLFLVVLSLATARGLPAAGPVVGKVATDGTVGPKQNLTGPVYNIPATLGTQVGTNLFHSFSDFSIGTGETASFSGPTSVANVIARVTGGGVSSIDGTLQCTIPRANFYLVNPAGVIFGPNASLDIQGSFAVTTADYLRLADNGRFDAADPGRDVLTTAAPAAFGFLKAAPAKIQVSGSALSVPAGNVISMVGGDIQVDAAQVSAAGGRVNLISAGAPGEVVLNAADPASTADVSSLSQLGAVQASTSTVAVDGQGGGIIAVRADGLTLANSLLSAQTYGGIDGGGVDILLPARSAPPAAASCQTPLRRAGPETSSLPATVFHWMA